MIKDKIIQKFENEIKEMLKPDEEEILDKVLHKRKHVKKFISKFKSLNAKEQNNMLLVLSTANSYHYSVETINMLLDDTFQEIEYKRSVRENTINLAWLYYALEPNKILYKRVLDEYLDRGYRVKIEPLKDYVNTLIKYHEEFHNLLDSMVSTTILDRSLTTLTPNQLSIVLDKYGQDQSKTKPVIDFFTRSNNSTMRTNLKKMTDHNFTSVLNQILKGDEELSEEMIISKLKFFEKVIQYSSDQSYLEKVLRNMNHLSNHFITTLGNKMNDLDSMTTFLNTVENNNSILKTLEKLPESYDDVMTDLYIKNDPFSYISKTQGNILLKYLIDYQDTEGKKVPLFQKSLEFLFEKENVSFHMLLEDDNKKAILCFKFLSRSNSMKVLEAKIFALNCIREQIQSLSAEECLDYLEFVQKNLTNYSEKKQAKMIQARSKYFQNHKVSKFHLEDVSKNLSNAMLECTSKKRMKQLYRFSKVEEIYNNEIANSIIEYISYSQNDEKVKELIDIVKTPEFLQLDFQDKKEALENYVIVNHQSNLQQNACLIVPDTVGVSEIINSTDHSLEFINKETGLKVYMKKQNNISIRKSR